MNNNYKKPNSELWSGRKTNSDADKEYIYQIVEMADFQSFDFTNLANSNSTNTENIGIIGYECEEGVRRNQGRVGARDGANAIRQQLGKLPIHYENKRIFDFGNAFCANSDMESCQEQLAEMVAKLISNNITPIIFGGGHDIAYGHFCGIQKALSKSAKRNVGIINFDAHFDLRDVEKEGTSGTPLSQIQADLEELDLPFDYFVLGIQEQGNTRKLFEKADKFGVECVLSEDCHLHNLQMVAKKINNFVAKCDSIYLTIDLDGFSSAFAPGVSATSPIGFEPIFAFKILKSILQTGKVISIDIAELNPKYDIDNATAKLGARLAEFVLRF